MAKHNIMRQFRLNEISGVDSPAQKGAKAVIMKRNAAAASDLYLAKAAGAELPDKVEEYLKRGLTTEQIAAAVTAGEALAGGAFVIKNRDDLECAIRAIGRAKDQGVAKSHIIARARALDAGSLLPSDWRVGKTIGGDLIVEISRVAPRVLPGVLDEVVKAEEIQAEIEKIEDKKARGIAVKGAEVAKAAVIAAAWSILDNESPGDAATLLQKNFHEYKDHMQGLVSGAIATPKEAGDESMLKAIAKALGLAETATEAEILTALNKNSEALKKAEAVSAAIEKMEPAERLFLAKGKLPEGGAVAFIAMEKADRKAVMDKNPLPADQADDDEKDCIKVDGRTIRKSVVGADVFTVMKSQQAAITKAADEAAVVVIAKRVAPLTHVISKAEDIAAMLHRVEKGTATKADADAIETLLKSANEVVSKSEKITKEFGKNSGHTFGKAADAIAAKAAELMKTNTKWSIEKARTEARKQNPDLATEEENENKEARRAA